MDNPGDARTNPKIASLAPESAEAVSRWPCPALSVAGQYRVRERQNYALHHHPGHELIVWRSGQVEVQLGQGHDQRVITVSPGMVTLWPGQLRHADRAVSAYSHVYLIFEADLGLPGSHKPLLLHDDEASSVERLVLAIEREFNGERPHRGHLLTLQLEQLMLMLLRLQTAAPDAAERLVRRLERLIEERYAENPSIAALAAELKTSSSNLRAQFARRRGFSPKSYLRQVRLQRALGDIRSSTLALEDIAQHNGYTSAGHLWHDVRDLTNRTPGSFRQDGSGAFGDAARAEAS